jgi:hypothetical protein
MERGVFAWDFRGYLVVLVVGERVSIIVVSA